MFVSGCARMGVCVFVCVMCERERTSDCVWVKERKRGNVCVWEWKSGVGGSGCRFVYTCGSQQRVPSIRRFAVINKA